MAGYFIKQENTANTGIVIPASTTVNRPTVPILGALRFNSSTLGMEYWNGTAYVELAKTGDSLITTDVFTGDAATTQFTLTKRANYWYNVMMFVSGIHQYGTGNYDVSQSGGLTAIAIGGTVDTTVTVGVNQPLTVSAPNLAAGVQATATYTSAAGDIDSVVITNAGSGYTAPPTITAPGQVNRTLTGTITYNTTTAILTAAPAAGVPIIVIHGLGDTYVPSANVFDVPNL